MRKDGKKQYSGLANLKISRIKSHLSKCVVICISCRIVRATHAPTTAAIRSALLNYKGSVQIQRELHADGKRVALISNQLFREGRTCLCGRKLAHNRCRFVKPTTQRHPTVRDVAPLTGCKGDRACPFPIHKDGRCRHHHQFYAFSESLTDDSLTRADFYPLQVNKWNPVLRVAYRSELRVAW